MEVNGHPLLWFGSAQHKPDALSAEAQVPVPIGAPCGYCEEPIEEGDHGAMVWEPETKGYRPYHEPCFARPILGSVAHVERRCGCYVKGETETDPPGMTKRQAAHAAMEASIAMMMLEERLGLSTNPAAPGKEPPPVGNA